jgi:hypothetical protein
MLFPSTYNCPLVESIDKAMSKMWNVYIKVWHREFRVSFKSDLNIFLVFLVFFGFLVFGFWCCGQGVKPMAVSWQLNRAR